MMLSRPGKFVWRIEKPYKQQLVGDGEKVWMYDPDLRQVTVRKFDALRLAAPRRRCSSAHRTARGRTQRPGKPL